MEERYDDSQIEDSKQEQENGGAGEKEKEKEAENGGSGRLEMEDKEVGKRKAGVSMGTTADAGLLEERDPLFGDTVLTAHDQLQVEIDLDLAAAQKPHQPKVVQPTSVPGEGRKRPAPPSSKQKTLSVLDYKRRRGLI